MPLWDDDKKSIWMLPGYMDGIIAAGGIPVMLPLTEDEEIIKQLLDTVQGILLTGGHDVDPAIYGEEPIIECGMPCKERDRMESLLLSQALLLDMPILGICRGIQFLNTFLGGTLYQDLPKQHPSSIEHHQSPPYDIPVHEVSILRDSALFDLLKTETLQVNSYHHQAVKHKADALRTMAVSSDGLIEAVDMPGKRFVWALQWHPEFSYLKDDSNRKIFEEYIKN